MMIFLSRYSVLSVAALTESLGLELSLMDSNVNRGGSSVFKRVSTVLRSHIRHKLRRPP